MEQLDEQSKLRKYILNDVNDEARSAIEERLLTDDEYLEEVSMAEENLIQDYADGNLDVKEREKFENCFLSSEENRQKVKFARALRKYVNEAENSPKTEKKPNFFKSLKAFFSAPVPIAFTFLIIAGIISFFVWKNSSRDSEALVAINKLNSRMSDGRIVGAVYAPKVEGTRGPNNDENPSLALVKSRATTAALENETAENLHELGLIYLAEKNFDEAIKNFEKAVKLAPNNAKIHNDLGVAIMEKANRQADGKMEKLSKAHQEFDKSIELDQTLPDAYFNRALCLQMQGFISQSKTAWKKYLQLDANSLWADEAKKHLQELENQTLKELSNNDLEKEFLNFYYQKNDEEAWKLISRNRELITGKYLPQRLAMSFLEAPAEEKSKKLDALKYLANLEKTRAEDFFASDVAIFYENASKENLEIARKAQNSVRKAYQYFHEDNFSEALNEFYFARKSFLQAGNPFEANTICLHFIGYIFYFKDKKEEAVENFVSVNDFSQQRKYKWLRLVNYIWLTGGRERLGKKPTNEIKHDYEKALKESEDMGDSFMTQKYLINLARRSSFVKQESATFNYLQKLFIASNQSQLSLRQKFRNFNSSIEMLPIEKFTSLSKSIVLESVNLAEASKNVLFLVDSQINAGIVYTKSGDFAEAEKWLEKANQNLENIQEESQKKEVSTKIFLKWGQLEKEQSNYQAATVFYDKAISILETTNTPIALYETKKSRLLAYQALGNDSEVEKQLPSTLKLADDNREIILDEQERNSFFDNEQTIYDVAIEHEMRKGNSAKAFDYTEASNSRSLLDLLQKGANISADKQKIEILLNESVKPQSITEFQGQIPSEVQILQYKILEEKVLIWLVSRKNLTLITSEINSDRLEEMVKEYLILIQSKETEKQLESQNLSRELFQVLIAPVITQLDKNKEICLIPNKFLFHLPFAALISAEGKYFLEQYKIFYAPSANVFIFCTENARTKTSSENEKIFSIGNPDFDKEEFLNLQDLPSAKYEATESSKLYLNPNLLVDKQATRKAFLSNYKNYEIIHFAGHYVFQADSPLRSKLVLAKDPENEPSFITNGDLIREKLQKTKLVVLSACQTGIEGDYKSEGLMGLSRTFLAMGVPLVVSSQWQIDSKATAIIMEKFHYYRRQQNLSTVNALREAQLGFLKEQGGTFKSPYYWAAFASFGGYTNF